MEGPLYESLCRESGADRQAHRKMWEFNFILAAFRHYGVLTPPARLLGFGIGQEPLPSAFAGMGLHVTATDAPPDVIEDMGWQSTNQHLSAVEQLWREHLVPRDTFDRLVKFEPADMNAIPDHLMGYDGCWSSCALEHLGSIDCGLDFIENSLTTLRPGGLAVHTTEFNLSSKCRDIRYAQPRTVSPAGLRAAGDPAVGGGPRGCSAQFLPGRSMLDEHMDFPPYAPPHLKLEVAGFTCSSFGIIVRKRAD